MSKEVIALGRIVREQTVVYRKGEVVKTKDDGVLHVTTIDAFPETPPQARLIDLHFVNIGFTESAADKEGFIEALKAAIPTEGEFNRITLHDFYGGPSYITIGAWLGDQTLALQFMGLCEFHEIGQVITPATLGIEGQRADMLAGAGMVMMQLSREHFGSDEEVSDATN